MGFYRNKQVQIALQVYPLMQFADSYDYLLPTDDSSPCDNPNPSSLPKDPRFLRGYQRKLLFWKHGGHCASCGDPLDSRNWHADHATPWVRLPVTNIYLMDPLCPICNLKKGSKMPTANEDPRISHLVQLMPGLYAEKARLGQKECVEFVITELPFKQSGTGSIVAPPRSGKTDCIRCAAYGAKEIGLVSGAIMLTVTDHLRHQAVPIGRGKRNHAHEIIHRNLEERYGIPIGRFRDQNLEEGFDAASFFPNDEHLVVTTIQMFQNAYKAGLIRKLSEANRIRSGLPILLIVDEGHLASDANKWGESVEKFVEMGNLALLVTGTPFRSDRDRIPGFQWVKDGESQYLQTIQYSHNPLDEDTLIRREMEGERTTYRVLADREVSWKDAFDLGYISKICIDRVDFDVSIPKGNDITHVKLSDINNEGVIRKALRSALRMDPVINKLVIEAIHHTRALRKLSGLEKAALLVFTGNDDRKNFEDDFMPKKVMEFINKHEPSWDIQIATGNEKGSRSVLSEFHNSRTDALIVKAMASVGCDWPRVMCVLDLSTVRARSSWLQRVLRGATPYMDYKYMILVTPYDQLSDNHIEFISNAGGIMGSVEQIEWETISQEIVPRDENPIELSIEIEGLGDTSFKEMGYDTHLSDEETWAVYEYKANYPELKDVGWVAICKMMKNEGVYDKYLEQYKERAKQNEAVDKNTDGSNQPIGSISDQIKRMRDRINACKAELARPMMNMPDGIELSNDEIGEIYKEIMSNVYYKKLGLSSGFKLSKCKDLALLNRILSAFHDMGATQ